MIARSKHHPDKGGNGEVFKKVNAAWELVDTPSKKEAYDRQFVRVQETSKSAFSGFGNYRRPPSSRNHFNTGDVSFEDLLNQYARHVAQQNYADRRAKPKARKSATHSNANPSASKKSSSQAHQRPSDGVYRITLPSALSSFKLIDGAGFTIPMKPKKLVAHLVDCRDDIIVLGKIYTAGIRGTGHIVPVIFDIKWKSPWSWDSELGLTYTASRVMSNVVKGGKMKIVTPYNETLEVKWDPMSGDMNRSAVSSIRLRLKGKGWPSEKLAHKDLIVKINGRKAPVKKAKVAKTFKW